MATSPTLPATRITYDLAERTRAISHGGLGAVINVVNRLKLAAVIDAAVKVLKAHRPYHESDHVLNIAYNILCGGRVLDAVTDVGARNIRFVREFVATEGYKIVGEDLGSTWPRKVLYHPSTGDARVKKLGRDAGGALAERERSYACSIDRAPVSGEIDLF